MKQPLYAALVIIFISILQPTMAYSQTNIEKGFAAANGIKLYYEIHNPSHAGTPLVLLHGGGSTIYTTFGRILPRLAKDRKIIAIELQAHGRSDDRNTPTSFTQDADDVAAALEFLHVSKADFFGFSNGGSTVLQIGIRHPAIVNKIIAAAAIYKRSGMPPQFWEFMDHASLADMPEKLRTAYLSEIHDQKKLQIMHDRDVVRMQTFKDWPESSVQSIKCPVFFISSDQDVVLPAHTLEMHLLLPSSRLAILPGLHGEFIGEVTTPQDPEVIESSAFIIEKFLDSK